MAKETTRKYAPVFSLHNGLPALSCFFFEPEKEGWLGRSARRVASLFKMPRTTKVSKLVAPAIPYLFNRVRSLARKFSGSPQPSPVGVFVTPTSTHQLGFSADHMDKLRKSPLQAARGIILAVNRSPLFRIVYLDKDAARLFDGCGGTVTEMNSWGFPIPYAPVEIHASDRAECGAPEADLGLSSEFLTRLEYALQRVNREDRFQPTVLCGPATTLLVISRHPELSRFFPDRIATSAESEITDLASLTGEFRGRLEHEMMPLTMISVEKARRAGKLETRFETISYRIARSQAELLIVEKGSTPDASPIADLIAMAHWRNVEISFVPEGTLKGTLGAPRKIALIAA